MTMEAGRGRDGFTLVEVIIAMVILAVGLLAMAATTGYLSHQITDADLRTERAIAVQSAAARLRAEPFGEVVDKGYASAWTIGDYKVWWNVAPISENLKRVQVMTEGPSFEPGVGVDPAVPDTTIISIANLP